jgi:2-dehydro-3-deoxyphosphogluconate aldolase / (4S)-4-hydroxy-2-oxoglutarate aldolase
MSTPVASSTRRAATLAALAQHRVSAIIRASDRAKAERAMDAAVRGGFRVVEFTLTTPGALDLVAAFAKRGDLVVGAGTVLEPRVARDAVAAGASFLVSPVTDPEIIREAQALDVVSIPGTSTPTEMLAAHRAGADILKIFPAPADLPAFITQVRGPFPELRLFPTAGVTLENIEAVLRAGAFGAGFVASLFTAADLASGNFGAIEAQARTICDKVKPFLS